MMLTLVYINSRKSARKRTYPIQYWCELNLFFPGEGDTFPNVTGLSALSYPDDFLGVLCPNVWSPVGWMVDWAVPLVWLTTLMVSSNSPNGIKPTTDHKKTQRGATELAQLVSNLNFTKGWQWWRRSIYSWMIEQPNLHERPSRHRGSDGDMANLFRSQNLLVNFAGPEPAKTREGLEGFSWIDYRYTIYLVGGLEHCLFSHILGIIIPIH